MIGDDGERDVQERALRDPRSEGRSAHRDLAADHYRLVYRVVREAEMPEIPANFATQLERLTRDQREPVRPALLEIWIVRIVLAATIVAALVSARPASTAARALLADASSGVPWPMLLAAGAAMLGVWTIDHLTVRRTANV